MFCRQAFAATSTKLSPLISRSLSSVGTAASSAGAGGLGAAKFRVVGLDGSKASLEAALAAIHDGLPKQVMLETCDQRRLLADRQAADASAAAVSSTDSAETRTPLSHADAIASVHGGLQSEDLSAVVNAATDVGAQVYNVDRPYQDTQNQVARRLVLNPKELLGFARHSAAVLSGAPQESIEPCPVAVERILGAERERYISFEASKRAVRGSEAILVCTAERAPALQQLLQCERQPLLEAPKRESTTRIWPFLLILVYVILPGYGSMFIFWRMARWGADVFRDMLRSGVPAIEDAPKEEATSEVPEEKKES
eukprot:TRINITY_DN109876_c0_g1_i1.p1 TRINITY_DN109876_c0_g1~~TRINITY_DN109876_c0_g1_i1.p1  ORF type:complete len:312 (-),score=61.06 TRINITY_DN109876_c0_g1_i1:46-981(-)